jgi:hypothetical protein
VIRVRVDRPTGEDHVGPLPREQLAHRGVRRAVDPRVAVDLATKRAVAPRMAHARSASVVRIRAASGCEVPGIPASPRVR